ncbi:MAG: AraC family transcriptional regulator [Deltaproteobacteria bacterium]|jgi:AraC-like DNA-binding protein|nr:AraC family transcriptional regulator [Deltaproteobacteria bacterium]
MTKKLKSPSVYDIKSDVYEQRVFLLSKDLTFWERNQTVRRPNINIDVFGATWFLGIGICPPGKVALNRKGEKIEFTGPTAFFIPPYSLIEWNLNPTQIQWAAFASERELPSTAPKEAICWDWPSIELPSTLEEIFSFLEKWKSLDYRVIEKIEKPSLLAAKVKAFIDAGYRNELLIAGLAQQLGVSRVAMGRAFKACYGISPVAYRNRLRLFYSLKLMSSGETVTAAAFNSGYSHLSRFNRQFREYMRTSPSEFCLIKKKPRTTLLHRAPMQPPTRSDLEP